MTDKGPGLVARAGRRLRRTRSPRVGVVARLNRQHERLAAVERDLARIGPQVAALEQRLEDVSERLVRWEAGDEEMVEARSLVAEMRAEHARVRERISAAARFEERLRVVEELVARERAGQGGEASPGGPATVHGQDRPGDEGSSG